MPTYQLIAKSVLSGTATTIDFNSIPATYTDLQLKWSVRTDVAATRTSFRLRFNNDSGANYSDIEVVFYDATSVLGAGISGASFLFAEYINGNTALANNFGAGQFYFPNYGVSQYHSANLFSGAIDNTNGDGIYWKAINHRSTTTISSINIYQTTSNFLANSSFYLYGIKNS